MPLLNSVQWPAMIVTVLASWYVSSTRKRRRHVGFWLFIASNVLWVVWGVFAHAYALIVLQVCLAAMNVRGVFKSEQKAPADDRATSRAQP
jgi:hypothetical protein